MNNRERLWIEKKERYEYFTHDYYEEARRLQKNRVYGSYSYGNPERLSILADEINVRIKITKREIFTIGELLYEAKKILQGGFKQWIADNFDFSYDTAHNFMNVYECCLGHKNLVEKVKSSILYKLSAPSFPEELRDFLFSQGSLVKMTNRKLEEILKKYKEGGIDSIKDDFEKITEGYRIYDQVMYTLDNLELAIRDLIRFQEKMETHDSRLRRSFLNMEDQEGHSVIGNEINTHIVTAIESCIKILDEVKGSSFKKLNKFIEPYRDKLGEKSDRDKIYNKQTGEWEKVSGD